MTLARDPTLRNLDDCGCCEGLGAETPEAIDNRPGLSAIAYRIGTHSRFKASMLARLSSADLPALARLSTRADRDFSIALLDSWAVVGDVLTFYQERFANEAYARTATERRSLVELANLIGYLPQPGVAASAYLAFTLDPTGVNADTPVPAGARVQSIPGPGQRPQAFETVESIQGRDEWNAMRPVLRQKHPEITPQTDTVTVNGITTGVQKGDSLLLLCGQRTPKRVVKRVLKVSVDQAAQTTRLDLTEIPPNPPPFIFVYLAEAIFTAAPLRLSRASVDDNVLKGSWRQANLKAFAAVQKWPLRKLNLSIVTMVRLARLITPPETGVFAFRQRAAIFGHNAPLWNSLPATQRFADLVTGSDGRPVLKSAPFPTSWEGRRLSDEPGNATNSIDVDNTYPGIVAGSWLVLEGGTNPQAYKVTNNREISRSAFTITAKVSRVTLDPLDAANNGFSGLELRNTTVLAQSEELTLADLPITENIRGDRLVLGQAYLGLQAGRPVVVSGERADLPGVQDSEVAILADVVLNEGLTELIFRNALANEYVRSTVTVNANVALATHGETRDQVLGSGDGNRPFQKFVLPEAPLTYISANNTRGALSTLQVRVNGTLWDEVDFLYGRKPDDHVYITRTGDDGRTSVQFGDGVTGARPPTGQENIRVTYRKGMGEEGLVDENQLTLPVIRPLGVRGMTNPVAASGAADPEVRDDVRRNGPLAIQTLGRIVSLRDYEDFARAFAGVAKALGTWTWNGHQRGIFVTVAGPKGADIAESSNTYNNLLSAMTAAGDPAVPLRVKTYRAAFFRVAARLAVDPAYQSDVVLAAVDAALRSRFAFEARDFGQPVAKSEVIAAMQLVKGVVAVDLRELYRTDATAADLAAGKVFEHLLSQAPRAGTDVTVAAELLMLDPRPVDLEVMSA